MKSFGVALVILGGLMVLNAIRLALTTYDLNSSHDFSKFCGGFGFSVVMFAIGISLITRKTSPPGEPADRDRENR